VRYAILLTAASSWYLVGLSMTVGLVNYPAFQLVGEREWALFHKHHSEKIAWAVGSAWVGQAAGLIWWFGLGGGGSILWWLTGSPAALAVALTAFSAVGIHNEISTDRQARNLHKLRIVHWVRTLCWVLAAVWVSWAIR